MKTETCRACDYQANSLRAITIHSFHKHKLGTKEYYDKFLMKEGEGICSECASPTAFGNVVSGYKKTCKSCSKKVGTAKQWVNNPERREKHSKRLLDNPMPNANGRPKGSKNKKPYPMQAFYDRQKKSGVVWRKDWTGKQHSPETKQKMSDSAVKRIFKRGHKLGKASTGMFKPKNYQKYKGNPTQIVYRSSWEAGYMGKLDRNPNVIKWSSEEIVIPYFDKCQGKVRRYFPDFYVEEVQKDGSIMKFIIEIKPFAQTKPPVAGKKTKKTTVNESITYMTNMAKWEAAEAYCAARGYTFKILTEKDLKILL